MEFFFIPHKWEGKYNFFQFFLPYYGSLVELYLEENVNFDSTPPPPLPPFIKWEFNGKKMSKVMVKVWDFQFFFFHTLEIQ